MTMHIKTLSLCLALSAACGTASAATIVTLDAPGSTQTFVRGIDKKGNIVGFSIDQQGHGTGFIRSKDGVYHPYQQQLSPIPWAISANGMSTGGTNASSVFIADPQGQVTASFKPDWIASPTGMGINNKGDVVGYGPAQGGSSQRAFLRKANGKLKEVAAPNAGTGSGQGTFAARINDAGIVAGSVVENSGLRHGFLRDAKGHYTVIDPPDSIRTNVNTIRKDGTIGGNYRTADNVLHAFLRAPDGSFTTFDAPGAGSGALQGTSLSALNNKGSAAGIMIDSNGVNHGYIRNASGHITVFDAPGAGTASGQGTFASTLNDKNQVVGDYLDSNGLEHGYLRTP